MPGTRDCQEGPCDLETLAVVTAIDANKTDRSYAHIVYRSMAIVIPHFQPKQSHTAVRMWFGLQGS
jgi:hypothetical protein